MNDPENIAMFKDLEVCLFFYFHCEIYFIFVQYRAEIHAAVNRGMITELQAQQLLEEHEAKKQLAELPLIQMPMIPPAIPVCFKKENIRHRLSIFFCLQ